MKIILKLTKILLLISWVINFITYLYWTIKSSYNDKFADYVYDVKPFFWHSIFVIIFTIGIVLMTKKLNNAISNVSEFKITYNLLEPTWLKGLNIGARRIFSILYMPVLCFMLVAYLIRPILNIAESQKGNLFEELKFEDNLSLAIWAIVVFLGVFIIHLVISLLIKLFNWIKIGFSSKQPIGH